MEFNRLLSQSISRHGEIETKKINIEKQTKIDTKKYKTIMNFEELDKWITIKSDNEGKLRQVLTYIPKESNTKKDGK